MNSKCDTQVKIQWKTSEILASVSVIEKFDYSSFSGLFSSDGFESNSANHTHFFGIFTQVILEPLKSLRLLSIKFD